MRRGMGNGEQGMEGAPQPFDPLLARSTKKHPTTRASQGAAGIPCSPFPVPHSPRTKRANGFSLIEIIAALLILAIAFAALMQVAGGSIGLTNNAADHAQAALWARSLLDSAGMEQKLQPGTSEGKFDDQYHWRLQVAPYQPGDAGNNTPMQIFKLDLDVMWGGRRERTAHFSTLRLVSAVPQAQGQLR